MASEIKNKDLLIYNYIFIYSYNFSLHTQLIHCILILFCLWVVCFVRPYKKYHINAIEIVMVLSLFYTTLSVYGGDNDLHIGLRAGFVTFAIPYVLGVGFILFLIGKLLWMRFW